MTFPKESDDRTAHGETEEFLQCVPYTGTYVLIVLYYYCTTVLIISVLYSEQ